MFYVARQEGFEEMAEDISRRCKTSGQCLWSIDNNANEAGKGRYSTIFDDGYFKDAAELPHSGVAGAIGGPIV
jgi:hypothetical protein